MITAKEANLETKKYIENPFNFKERYMRWFEQNHEDSLNHLKYHIEEQIKHENFSVNFEIIFKEIEPGYIFFTKTIDSLLHAEYFKNKLSNLIEYLESKEFKVNLKETIKKRIFLPDEIIGFTFEISWEISNEKNEHN